MTDSNDSGNQAAPTTPTAPPGTAQKATRAPHRPQVAPSKRRSPTKATQGKQAPKGTKKTVSTHGDTKKARVIALLQKPKGATLADLMKATGWQPHSVRGFLSGALTKKMGLKLKSDKREDGQRAYSIGR